MRKLTGGDLKELGLLKHYRIIRKWACKTNGITDADLELLIYFDCLGQFRKRDFEDGSLTYSWDNRRCKCLIQQMYRIMLGEEDIPTSTRRNPLMKKDTYSAKVYSAAFDKVNKDKTR
jgi:hypothetical protein